MKALFKITLALLMCCSVAGAAQYWVSTNGNNSNPGTQALPWLTVSNAARLAKSNDFIHVTAGTYDEKVTPSFSGAAGTNITYKGESYPIIRGFDFTGRSNWAVIGFHFYHPSTNYHYDAIAINRCLNFRILDNYFDSINAIHAVVSTGNSSGSAPNYSSYGLIRSNRFYRAGLVPGGPLIPEPNLNLTGTNNLVEYNDASVSDDFSRLDGQYNIIRNNYYHDTQYSNFSNQPHTDFMQVGSALGGIIPNFDHNIFERNMMVSNANNNGHLIILQNYTNAPEFMISDFLVRQNVAIYTGGGIGLIDCTPNVRFYNNTFFVLQQLNGLRMNYCSEVSTNINPGANPVFPTNFASVNDIYESMCTNTFGLIFIGNGISAAPPYYARIQYDLSYNCGPSIAGSSGHCLTNVNPRFVNTNALDVHLTNGSPCIAAAGPQTFAVGGGAAANVVTVKDAGFFTDGRGIADVTGDSVIVGTNAAASVTAIDYTANTLTLSANITWNNGDGVALAGTQDIGAYNYDPAGYNYGISLTAPANRANILGATTLTASVTNPSKVRIVRFYVDGIEVGNAPPAATVSINATITGTNNVVQARAYALYADTALATISSVTVNQPPFPPPSELHILNPQ
jgi:hypothetical protein